MNEIRKAINEAYHGIIPTLESPLPSFVTHDFVFRIMEEIYRSTLQIAFTKVQECKNKGIVIDLRNQIFLEVGIEIENLTEIEKQEIFKKFHLLHHEDSPSLIIHRAIERFSKESLIFARKMRKMEEKYKEHVDLIMRDEISQERLNEILKKTNDSE